MKISIVTSLYQSASYLDDFYKRSKNTVQQMADDYEIIFVNDASPDDSLNKAIEIQKQDKNVSVIELSRNFGQHKAIMTGLAYAKGDLIFLLDSDLEESPELLEAFYEKLEQENCDVVYGVQRKRKGGWFERISGYCFYKFINFISDLSLTENLISARLMTKDYVKKLLEFKERELFLAGIWQIVGYKQAPLLVEKISKGSSAYSFRKKLSVMFNAITSFTNKPLVFVFYAGSLICLFSIVYILYLIFMKIFFAHPISGWASLIVSVWFLGGLTIFFIGLIGLYLSKIFMEVKQRPYSIVKKVYRDE